MDSILHQEVGVPAPGDTPMRGREERTCHRAHAGQRS